MTNRFDYFVVFAEMRTGSNFLESNLNAFPGLECHGEAFNPHFIGYPNRDEVLGVSFEARSQDPQRLLDAIRGQDDVLAGFRYFHDHDPRVLQTCLNDPRCAKIILTRNPVDSYVSWKIAQATGQWKLTDLRRRKDSKITFDGPEFARHIEALQSFQVKLLNALQVSGQTAFYVAYEDLQNLDVINGLGKFLGQEQGLEALDASLKRQNPAPLSDKVENYEDISTALVELDRFNLSRTPNFEPRRGAAVPTYLSASQTPLLFLPLQSGPMDEIADWLAALDQEPPTTGHNQKSLRQWKRAHPGFRSFTVLRHPVARAHATFCQRILITGEGSFKRIRKTLEKMHKVPLPGDPRSAEYDVAAHKAAFVGYLRFVKANLAGQTGMRVDSHWATQASQLQGFANVGTPDMVLREDALPQDLPDLAARVGRANAPMPRSAAPDMPHTLADIYDDEIEALVSDIYQRDYVTFGFVAWG